MKILKSKTPYLILLLTFLCVAATDSLVWSEQIDPVVVEINEVGEMATATPEINQRYAFQNVID